MIVMFVGVILTLVAFVGMAQYMEEENMIPTQDEARNCAHTWELERRVTRAVSIERCTVCGASAVSTARDDWERRMEDVDLERVRPDRWTIPSEDLL